MEEQTKELLKKKNLNDIPCKLWENYDVLPTEKIQGKMNILYRNSREYNYEKYMKFESDDLDQMAQMYMSPRCTMEEKRYIIDAIKKI